MITIVTGSRGVGKTTLLQKLIEDIKKKGIFHSGIITTAVYNEDGTKVGFNAVNAATGNHWELGRSDRKLNGPDYGPFSFSEYGFIRSNKILKMALTEDTGTVLIDEIGPLELRKGYGFSPILPLISGFNLNRDLFLVIRSELIDEFVQKFLGTKEHRIIRVTSENRDDLKIFEKLY